MWRINSQWTMHRTLHTEIRSPPLICRSINASTSHTVKDNRKTGRSCITTAFKGALRRTVCYVEAVDKPTSTPTPTPQPVHTDGPKAVCSCKTAPKGVKHDLRNAPTLEVDALHVFPHRAYAARTKIVHCSLPLCVWGNAVTTWENTTSIIESWST